MLLSDDIQRERVGIASRVASEYSFTNDTAVDHVVCGAGHETGTPTLNGTPFSLSSSVHSHASGHMNSCAHMREESRGEVRQGNELVKRRMKHCGGENRSMHRWLGVDHEGCLG